MTKKKAIIIGAGPGGLVCANKLAMNGLEVTLLEMHNKVGGLAQAWTRKPKLTNGERVEATFELTHAISDCLPGGSNYKLFEKLGADHSRIGPFLTTPKFAALRTPNEEKLEVLNSLESSKQYLIKQFPEEAKGIDKIFDIITKIDQQMATHRLDKEWKKKLERLAEHAKALKIPTYLLTRPTLLRRHNQTFEEILNSCLKNEDIKAWFSTLYGYVGLPISKASGTLYTAMLMSYWTGGGPQAPAENSFQAMHEELARAFAEKHGGDLRLLSKATRINVENRTVKGVEVETQKAGREKYNLDADYVIVAGDMKKAMLPLKEHLPPRYAQKLEETKMSISLMSVHAIVEKDLPKMEGELSYAANVLASSKEASENPDGNNFPEHHALYLSVPTVLRPNAKLVKDMKGNHLPNYHIIDVVMQSPPYGMWDKLRREDCKAYRKLKDWYADKMLHIAEERLIPGLREAVRYKEVYTAKTHERFCDCTEGAVYNFDPTPGQFHPNRFPAKTPIKGLYLTGSTVIAAGVGGAISGAKLTAAEILEDINS